MKKFMLIALALVFAFTSAPTWAAVDPTNTPPLVQNKPVKKPVAKKPAKKPVAKKPVAKKPVKKKPAVAKKPAKKKPAIAKKPASKKPLAKKKTTAKKPVAKHLPIKKKPAKPVVMKGSNIKGPGNALYNVPQKKQPQTQGIHQ